MTRQEVQGNFSTLINEDGEIYFTPVISMTVDAFVERFESVELSYDSLSSHPACTPAWLDIFNILKSQGLLN